MTLRELINQIDSEYLFYEVLSHLRAIYYNNSKDKESSIYKYFTIAKDNLKNLPQNYTNISINLIKDEVYLIDDTDIQLSIEETLWGDIIDSTIIANNTSIEVQLSNILHSLTTNGYTVNDNIKYIDELKRVKRAYRDDYLNSNLISWESVVNLSKK